MDLVAKFGALMASHPVYASLFALWMGIATYVNLKLWPRKPAWPMWLKVVHYILIDAPAWAASNGYNGVAGKFNLPLVPSFGGAVDTAKLLLVFGVLGMGLAGCATLSPAQKAFDACFLQQMEQKGISAAGAAGQEAWSDLSQGTSKDQVYGQLEGLAGRAGVDTVVSAASCWLNQRGAALNPAGVAAAKAWLSAHAAH